MLDVRDLPEVNAGLNALSAVFLTLGWALIRSHRVALHRAAMLTAAGCSLLFFTSYLIYHFQVGSVPFPGQGGWRTVYFAVLIPHTILAATVPVLATITLVHALRRRFQRHRRIARWTLPIWLFVSVTGIVVYWMLYRVSW
jgi:uncharacterized membrane protein YozB (DUF420 family)